MSELRGIAIVGAGIVGASIAYHLSRRMIEPLTVFERDTVGSSTTAAATAMIGDGGPEPFLTMKGYGFRLYNELLADPTSDVRYRLAGRLRVATTEAGDRLLRDLCEDRADEDTGPSSDTRLKESITNSRVEYFPGDSLHNRFILPPLDSSGLQGGLYRPLFGYVTDDSRTLGAGGLARELLTRAEANGVTVATDTTVTDITIESGAVTGIELDGDRHISLETLVLAAGPWNAGLARHAGISLPIELEPAPVYALKLPDPLPYTLPMIKHHESGIGIHPKRPDRILLTASPDSEHDIPVTDPTKVAVPLLDRYRESTRDAASTLMPTLDDGELIDEWIGFGTVTPDGKPILGKSSIDGLILAVTRSGIQYAPAVGSILARQLIDDESTEFDGVVSVDRFETD